VSNAATTKGIALFLITNDSAYLMLEVDYVFLMLSLFITLSLFLTQLTSLIYRVINLAIISLLVVGTWAYFTDITFLYIVYILAFVGAVIMLFLSVILMLPASVTAGSLGRGI